MLSPEISETAPLVAALLREHGETVSVAEGSAGGLVSAALLSVPGASAYYLGGTVIYTAAASRAWMAGEIGAPPGMRGATEAFAGYLAESVRLKVGSTWGIGEAGAAGPANPYGDPAGHSWLAISGTWMDRTYGRSSSSTTFRATRRRWAISSASSFFGRMSATHSVPTRAPLRSTSGMPA